MRRRVLKKPVLYGIYAVGIVVLIGGVYLIERSMSSAFFEQPKKDDYEYVSDTILDEEVPVVSTTKQLIKPYTDPAVQIVKGYYNYQGEAEEQKNSLIYYENQYLQNSGISYGGVEAFDVVAVFDGTVIDVKEDGLLGFVIEIRHSNDVIGVYQSVSDVVVQKDDQITQGMILAKSGNSNISKDLNRHLHFELIVKGQAVNPEEYYGKNITEL